MIDVVLSASGTCPAPDNTPYEYDWGCTDTTYYETQAEWETDFCADKALTLKSNVFL